MEIDPGYCDVIVRRWQDYTGKRAVLRTQLEDIVQMVRQEAYSSR